MDRNLLDNLSCQEIKELIDNEIISLQELQDSTLERVLNFEIEMLCHGSGDMDMLRRCAETLDARSKSDKLNHDEISDIINKTKSVHVTISKADNSPSIVAPPRKTHSALKRIAIVAAAIIILITTTSAIAVAFGIDVFRFVRNIIRQPDGTTADIDEFTFQNLDVSREYDSIEQMIEAEDLDIMYPSLFPDGANIKIIRIITNTNNKDMVQINTNHPNVNVQIELDTSEFVPEPDEIREHNGVTYYVRKKEVISATCYYKNNTYYISANNYEDLILIIDNMKE